MTDQNRQVIEMMIGKKMTILSPLLQQRGYPAAQYKS
jgi:hypothetical protein